MSGFIVYEWDDNGKPMPVRFIYDITKWRAEDWLLDKMAEGVFTLDAALISIDEIIDNNGFTAKMQKEYVDRIAKRYKK